ncbi:C39 family peptidase [Kribbella sp. NPDC059898]|uniref:C39 family peptidase n=1 Tax=Kribbella sp. NPDC059898 TaxID=3346995 RepID=UPI00366582BE
MIPTTKFKAALCGLALVAAAVLPVNAASAVPDSMSIAVTKPVPKLGYSTQSVKTLTIDFQYQQTGYWCGPAATRIALSARISPPSQQQLANELPTTTNGTDWIGQVTRVLNNHVGTGWYETKEMPNDPPTQAQRDLLWRDIVLDIDNNYPIVANIVAPANNHPPGYPNYTIYHYFTVIGYDSGDQTVLIADPAGFAPTATYWLTFNQLATLIPPKGYSA